MRDENGYELWLRYSPLSNEAAKKDLTRAFGLIFFPGSSPSLSAARDELRRGLRSMLGFEPEISQDMTKLGKTGHPGYLVVGCPSSCRAIDRESTSALGPEGYRFSCVNSGSVSVSKLEADSEIGILYGVFGLLRRMARAEDASGLCAEERPRMALRMLQHWDNLDRSVERGYAGGSLWDWHTLPGYLPRRYRDYARANASIGVNAVCVTNVNSNALVLTDEYIEKAAGLAGVFRPYGIRLYLTARFNAPMELGSLPSADPADPLVQAWWRETAARIYSRIPDFGGFVVKANSEGQPGPQDYKRSHAEGANLLAGAVAPFGGRVIWRAFVYSNEVPDDRAKQAYDEFTPIDGKFLPNVSVQAKNGAIDFQPREPFHPLFGAMPKTPLVAEFQLTQEYLGFATHLAYLAPLFRETLVSDTYCEGPGSEVGRVVSGKTGSAGTEGAGMAAVSNIGECVNWTGHPFGQANWYALGRLAWDWTLSAEDIADEWISQTFDAGSAAASTMRAIMMESREAVVDYMTPLGLHHLMGWSHHYGPGPWIDQGRRDWTSVYFHRADPDGIGFERGPGGSDAVAQYRSPLKELFGKPETCPEELLLWFHHVPWDYRMKSGKSLWDELCLHYQRGVDAVRRMRSSWETLSDSVDNERFEQVQSLLRVQEKEAIWWKDACLSYFGSFAARPLPEGVEAPAHTLQHYRSIVKRFVPGN